MTDKNKSLNLLIEKERNEANEQLLIENKDLKQRISTLLAYISSLEYKLNNLYHKEEIVTKNTVKSTPNSVNPEEFKERWLKMMETKPSQLIVFEDDEEVEYRGKLSSPNKSEAVCNSIEELEQIIRSGKLNVGAELIKSPYLRKPFPEEITVIENKNK